MQHSSPSEEASRPSKRGREEDKGSDVIVPHADLWFEDGNVVLVAGQCGFRVHKSILARKSEIMKDLFSLAQPLGGETFENCPVVRLADEAELIAAFLDLLYNRPK